MSSLLYFGVKVEQYFVSSSCIFLDIKTLLKVWLNPGLMLTISRGTGPWPRGYPCGKGYQVQASFMCNVANRTVGRHAV